MQQSNAKKADIADIQHLVAFGYMFLCCLNQYVKVAGIPVFIFLILIYSFLKLLRNGFVIRNSFSNIIKSSRWVLNFFSCWILYGLFFAAIIWNEAGWRNVLYIAINSLGFYNAFVDSYNDEKVRVSLIRGIICGLCANMLVAVWELQTGRHVMSLTSDYLRRFANVPLGFYVNTNDLAIVLIFFLVAVTVSYIYNRPNNHLKLAVVGLIIGGCFIVFSTGSLISRATIISLILFSYLFYQFKKRRKNGFIILIITTFFLLIVLIVDNGNVFNVLSIRIDDPAFTLRGDLWSKTLDVFKSTYCIGIGPGQNSVVGVGSVHNLLLEIVSEYGFIIGFIFSILYALIFRTIIGLNNSLITNIGFSLCLLMIPMSICSSSMTKLFPIWPCIGLILSFVILDSERREKNDYNGCANLSN